MPSDTMRKLMEQHDALVKERAALTSKILDVYGQIVDLQETERLLSFDYRAYLQTPEWKGRAHMARQRVGFRCSLCNMRDVRLHVHHRTYDRIGNEASEDLICLCEACHRKFHDKTRVLEEVA